MTPYEKGFIEKCAEYDIDPVALAKYASNTEYGSGIADSFRDIGDSFRKGGVGNIAARQKDFNQKYKDSSIGWRLANLIKHPIRMQKAREAAILGQ